MRLRELPRYLVRLGLRAALLSVCLYLGLGVSGVAAAETPAPVSVWYRSSEGCPDGPAFVARLLELGRSAALANVGDRVDFVVTLAAKTASSAGRLERQTGRGTVAIREVESPACADVAEALALSLELTLDPALAGASAELPAMGSAATVSEHWRAGGGA